MVEVPTDKKNLNNLLSEIQKRFSEESVIVVLDKDEVKTLKRMIKDREAFGRLFSYGIYVAGGIMTLFGAYTIFSNLLKWTK